MPQNIMRVCNSCCVTAGPFYLGNATVEGRYEQHHVAMVMGYR